MDSKSRKLRQQSGRSQPNLSALILIATLAAVCSVAPLPLARTISLPAQTPVRPPSASPSPTSSRSSDAQSTTFKQTFDATFYADLANAGIFDVVSKSLLPSSTPGSPSEVQLQSYSNAPAGAAFVAFGSLGVVNSQLVVNGYLFDSKNAQYPQVLAKQYSEDATDDSARQVAHRFADEIIFRLGGGTPGIAETKIYFVKIAGGEKEIWVMDYDGANQHPITHLGAISISPRVSPDSSRLAFATLGKYGFQLKMYSLLLGRYVNFPSGSEAPSRPHGRPAATSSPTLQRPTASSTSGSRTPTAIWPARSPASAEAMSRRSTIRAPARRSPSSARPRACPSSTS